MRRTLPPLLCAIAAPTAAAQLSAAESRTAIADAGPDGQTKGVVQTAGAVQIALAFLHRDLRSAKL
jgi:hypothetical protein